MIHYKKSEACRRLEASQTVDPSMSEMKRSKAGKVGSGLGAELSVMMCSAERAFSVTLA